MKVYLVIGGNVPEDVFSTASKAQDFIADRCKFTGFPPNYYRVFEFEVDRARI